MKSVKLSVTCKKPLADKYTAKGLAQIEAAIARWIKADAARGIQTHHVAIDDPAAMKKHGVAPVSGDLTAAKVKVAIDALIARLAPQYVVLIGSDDVVPLFEVENPTRNENGDTDPSVPTDNPYASSRRFDPKRRRSYLIPDRVVGRIPDVPGSGDPRWLVRYLEVATVWTSRPPKQYATDLLVCCDTWKKSGKECVEYLSRDATTLMISPPTKVRTAALRARHKARLHLIKCHGGPIDSTFSGQRGDSYPDVLRSTQLERRTTKTTLVGAMCCFGASVFDPLDPAALHPGEPPIPSVYLRQGAFGFFGSTCTAWVGEDTMLAADWVVSAFLKSVLAGASLGRAALEAKQDFVRWLQLQGDDADDADEKTLLQFMLLGDPSIHPVAAASPAARATSALSGAQPTAAVAMARRQRRAARQQLGAMLRDGLPRRTAVGKGVPSTVKSIARQLAARADRGKGFKFTLSKPRVQRLQSEIAPREATVDGVGPVVAARRRRAGAGKVVRRKSYQYYWAARRKRGHVFDIRLVSIQADPNGNVLRTQVLSSS